MQPISLFPNGIVKFPSGCFSMPQHNLSTETVEILYHDLLNFSAAVNKETVVLFLFWEGTWSLRSPY